MAFLDLLIDVDCGLLLVEEHQSYLVPLKWTNLDGWADIPYTAIASDLNNFFKKMGNSQPLSLYFRLFNTVTEVQYKIIPMTGPLESEATTLPTETQPLP